MRSVRRPPTSPDWLVRLDSRARWLLAAALLAGAPCAGACVSNRVSAAAALHNLRGTEALVQALAESQPGAVRGNEAGGRERLPNAGPMNEARLDDAEARFRLALELSPRFAEAHANLGLVLAQRGQYAAALGALEQAVAIDPDLAAAHVGLGNVHGVRGELDDAIDAYETALSIQPEMPEPRRNLIRLLIARERFVSARAHAVRLLQLEPRRAETVATLAYCEVRLGRPAAALARLAEFEAEAEARRRPDPASRSGRSTRRAHVRRSSESPSAPSAPSPPSAEPSLVFTRALALLARGAAGDLEASLGSFDTLIEHPEHGEAARLRRAAILADLGRLEEARAACRMSRRHGDDARAIARIEAVMAAPRAAPGASAGAAPVGAARAHESSEIPGNCAVPRTCDRSPPGGTLASRAFPRAIPEAHARTAPEE